MAGKAGTAQDHANRVGAALQLLATGKARSKGEAAKMVGLSQTSLTPGRLAPVIAHNPALRAQLRTTPLEIAVKVDGETITLREGLSIGAEKATEIICKLGAKLDKLNRAEQGALARARTWLDLAAKLGLFKDATTPQTPAELAAAATAEAAPWYLQPQHTHKPATTSDLLLTIPDAEIITSPDNEGAATNGKVNVQPCAPEIDPPGPLEKVPRPDEPPPPPVDSSGSGAGCPS